MVYLQFPFYQNHLDLAHQLWNVLIKKNACVIDATCGNGHDTLFLARLLDKVGGGTLHSIDIQEKAILRARQKLSEERVSFPVHWYCQSHRDFHPLIEDNSVDLIVYNLGYLPGGDKNLTTQTESTIQSIHKGLELLKPGGCISVTAYPGHPEGKQEEAALRKLFQELSPKQYCITYTQFLNRKLSPSFFFLQTTYNP